MLVWQARMCPQVVIADRASLDGIVHVPFRRVPSSAVQGSAFPGIFVSALLTPEPTPVLPAQKS